MLSGAKVHLRAPTEGDLGALYELASELDTWEERNTSPPRPLGRAEFAEQYRKSLTQDNPDFWFVIEAGGGVIGRCSIYQIDQLAHHAEIGISLHAAARGKGHGADALRVLVRFAFERRNLHRVQLGTLASNTAAIACYRKVGFIEEGRRRENAWVRGEYQDEIEMGLLRSEWLAGR